MAAKTNLVSIIPATKNRMLLLTNRIYEQTGMPYNMPPSRQLPFTFAMAEIEWPELKEAEDGYLGEPELVLKKRNVVRIYCKHTSAYDKKNPPADKRGDGSEESPFVSVHNALDIAKCYVAYSCMYIQIVIMVGSDTIYLDKDIDVIRGDRRVMIGSVDGETFFKLFNLPTFDWSGDGAVRRCVISQCELMGGGKSESTMLYKSVAKNALDSVSCGSCVECSFDNIGGLGCYASDAGVFDGIVFNCNIMKRNNSDNYRYSINVQAISGSKIGGFQNIDVEYGIFHSTISTPRTGDLSDVLDTLGHIDTRYVVGTKAEDFRVSCNYLIDSDVTGNLYIDLWYNQGPHYNRVETAVSGSIISYSVTACVCTSWPVSGGRQRSFAALVTPAECAIDNVEAGFWITLDPKIKEWGGYTTCGIASIEKSGKVKCVSNCKSEVFNFTGDESYWEDAHAPDCNDLYGLL